MEDLVAGCRKTLNLKYDSELKPLQLCQLILSRLEDQCFCMALQICNYLDLQCHSALKGLNYFTILHCHCRSVLFYRMKCDCGFIICYTDPTINLFTHFVLTMITI